MSRRNMCSRLKHRLSLQQEVLTADDAGGFVRGWQEIAQLWADLQPITGGGSKLNTSSGKEVFMAGQVQAQISHRITLRWREGVSPSMRLVFEGRAFNIRYVADIGEANEVLELLVQEGVAA